MTMIMVSYRRTDAQDMAGRISDIGPKCKAVHNGCSRPLIIFQLLIDKTASVLSLNVAQARKLNLNRGFL
jgi:hypothetical protein